MTLDEYLNAALQTWAQRSDEDRLRNAMLGIAGEVGEVVEVLKKFLYHGKTQDETRAKLLSELGDLLYYLVIYTHECKIETKDSFAESWHHPASPDELFWMAMRLSQQSAYLLSFRFDQESYTAIADSGNDLKMRAEKRVVATMLRSVFFIGREFGIAKDDITSNNIAKLKSRHPQGWQLTKLL